jgi:dCTP diphosphatase
MDVKAILCQFNQFADDRDWDQFHTIKNLSMALSVESSELLELFQWAKDDEIQDWIKNDANKKNQIAEEVADIFMYLLKIADKAEIDLESAIKNKMQKNAEKYPVEKAKGNSKKYTEL